MSEDFHSRPSTRPESDLLQLMIEWEWIKQQQRERWARLIEQAQGEN